MSVQTPRPRIGLSLVIILLVGATAAAAFVGTVGAVALWAAVRVLGVLGIHCAP